MSTRDEKGGGYQTVVNTALIDLAVKMYTWHVSVEETASNWKKTAFIHTLLLCQWVKEEWNITQKWDHKNETHFIKINEH